VTGILTGCTLELELVAVTVIVKVPGGVTGGGGGGGGAEPPPQPTQSSTANAPAAKTHRGMRLLDLSQTASRTITSRQRAPTGQARTLTLAGGSCSVGQGESWARAEVLTVMVEELPEAGLGLNVAVAAAGNPVAVKVKLSAKPVVREIVTV
jgi:hypothetical protein